MSIQDSIQHLPLCALPLPEVRWGFIGLGARGLSHLEMVLKLDGARVTAICDGHSPYLARATEAVRARDGRDPEAFGAEGEGEWLRLIESENVDAVLISTAWQQHAAMAVAAMQAGKHAFVEIPAAVTIEECWQLVEASEATGRHCMMLENCNYGREELMLLNMVRQGLLGDILHGEAAYLHELRAQMFDDVHGTGSWRTYRYATEQGNLYPTHGVGPIAHCMDVNRGDKFDYLVSMSSPARGRQLFAREKFPSDHPWNQIDSWRCGDLSTSLIKLHSGRTVMVQWDETSPRPYSRHNYLQGTRGAFGGFPNRIAVDWPLAELPEAVRFSVPASQERANYHEWDTNLEPWFEAYDHPLWKRAGRIAEANGGHGGMDFLMLWRVQECLLRGKPMDQSVYDAALWSAITPLSCASVEAGSAPRQFPDFTRGKWRTTPPVELF